MNPRSLRWVAFLVPILLGLGAAAVKVKAVVERGTVTVATAPPNTRAPWTAARLPSAPFVVTCQFSHELPDDPILHPNHRGASHLHSFYGNKATAADDDFARMRSALTTCDDPRDTAAYWVPSPGADYLRAYYDLGEASIDSVTEYAPNAKAIAGDPSVREPGVDVVGFRCGAVGDGPDGAGWVSAPPSACDSGGSVVRYTFGQCVEKPDGLLVACGAGNKPSVVRLRLLMEWKGFAGALGPHADFWNSWDQDRLEELVAVCVRGERSNNTHLKQCRLPGSGPQS